MNDNSLQNIFSRMKAQRLSAAEHVRIREQLLARIQKDPVATYREFSFMRFIWTSSTPRVYVSVLSVFVILFGAASYAAERTLPGDSLYALKTNINEPIRKVFAVSEKAKAVLEADLTDRRLSEASELARESRLDQETQELLFGEAAEHATLLRVALTNSGDTLDSKEVDDFSARLKQSQKVRVTLEENTTGNAPTFASAETALMDSSVSSRAFAPAVAPTPTLMALDATVSLKASVGEDVEGATHRKLKRVEEEYDKAAQILEARRVKISEQVEQESVDRRQGADKPEDD